MWKWAAALVLVAAGCSGGSGPRDAAAPDMAIPLCSTVQPPDDFPTGPCAAGAECTHPPPEGWSCDCPSGADMSWRCSYIGQEPDLGR